MDTNTHPNSDLCFMSKIIISLWKIVLNSWQTSRKLSFQLYFRKNFPMLKFSKVPFSSLNALTVKYENAFELFIVLSLNHTHWLASIYNNLACFIIFSNNLQYIVLLKRSSLFPVIWLKCNILASMALLILLLIFTFSNLECSLLTFSNSALLCRPTSIPNSSNRIFFVCYIPQWLLPFPTFYLIFFLTKAFLLSP